MVNKFYYIKGGSETYYFALKRLLESRGHTVIDFSMKDPKNFSSPYSDYFVENVDYAGKSGIREKMRIASNIIYSREAKQKFEALVREVQPDLVHLHIFQHQISPSILDVIGKYQIPCVYTAHDLKMLCLNYKMMHHGHLCEECKGGKYYRCAVNRCVKDSFAKSCINVAEGYFHKWRKTYDHIDVIITPSAFYRKKFSEFGIPENRVVHIPNFLDREKPIVGEREDKEHYYLYFGRLSEEKGVLTLLRAVEKAGVKAKIIGTGPLEAQIREQIRNRSLENVQMLGFKSGQELIDEVGNAKAVVLPSEWYENGPYSAIEALQMGRPVIGADIGGIPELIDGNGYLFESGNDRELANALLKMESLSEEEYHEMCRISMELFEKNYSQETHFEKLKAVYQSIGVRI